MRFKELADRIRTRLPQSARNIGARLFAWPENRKYRKVAATYLLPGGFRRIYTFHIRKTAGSSLHQAFLGAGGGHGAALEQLLFLELNTRIINNGFAYAGHNRTVIEAGHYFYGFSHRPYYDLTLPERTFQITALRDPESRLLSYYRMLLGALEKGDDPGLIRDEGAWIGNGLDDFLDRAPKRFVLEQLYMFSERYDVAEAAENIAKLEFVFLTEEFAQALRKLSAMLKLDLREYRARPAPVALEPTAPQRKRLREYLQPEYELLARLGLDPANPAAWCRVRNP